MQRLGYTRYVAQGGDWGSFVVEMMALQAPPELIGIHTNFPHAVPPDVSKAIQSGGVAPSGLSDDERRQFELLKDFFAKGLRVRTPNGTPSTDAVRNCGFTRGPGRLDARLQRAQFGARLSCF